MPAYDSDLFNPPAPVASVILRDPDNGKTASDVLMLIDTGADVTIVPQASIDELKSGFDPQENYELEGFDGRRSFAQSVRLELVFLRRTFKGRFLIINSEVGILGRDVLNHIVVALDGPRLSWQELKATSSK